MTSVTWKHNDNQEEFQIVTHGQRTKLSAEITIKKKEKWIRFLREFNEGLNCEFIFDGSGGGVSMTADAEDVSLDFARYTGKAGIELQMYVPRASFTKAFTDCLTWYTREREIEVRWHRDDDSDVFTIDGPKHMSSISFGIWKGNKSEWVTFLKKFLRGVVCVYSQTILDDSRLCVKADREVSFSVYYHSNGTDIAQQMVIDRDRCKEAFKNCLEWYIQE